MGKFRVVIIAVPNNQHSACFTEVALLLKHSLCDIGYDCDISVNEFDKMCLNIVLGANLLVGMNMDISGYSYIVYQLEQLSDDEGWYSPAMIKLLQRAYSVWDYSLQNIDFLKKRGVNAQYLLPGYSPHMEIIPRCEKDIDLLFYGSLNDRRKKMLTKLSSSVSKNLHVGYGLYQNELYKTIARTKIVLNIHFYKAAIFEAIRISFLLNNGIFVLSEESKSMPYESLELETCEYDEIPVLCRKLLHKPEYLRNKAEKLRNEFKKHYSMTALVGDALSKN